MGLCQAAGYAVNGAPNQKNNSQAVLKLYKNWMGRTGLAPGHDDGLQRRREGTVAGADGSSGLGRQCSPLPAFPHGVFLCLEKGIILQIVLQAFSCWCILALGSPPSTLTQSTCKSAGSLGGPAELGPHLAAVGRP